MNKRYSIKYIHFKLMIPYIMLLLMIIPFLTSNDLFTKTIAVTNAITTCYLIIQHAIFGYKNRQVVNIYDKNELQQIILSILFIPAILFIINLLFSVIVVTFVFIVIFIPFLGIPAILLSSYGLYQIYKMILNKYNRLINQ